MPFDKTDFDHELSEFEAKSDTGESRTVRLLYLGVFVLVALWGGSVALFGLPGLFLPALAMVPVMVLILVRLTRG